MNRLAPDDIDKSLIENFEPPVEDLVEEFKYKVKPTEVHRKLLKLVETYYINNEKFMKKKNLCAAVRARKALSELRQIATERRAEIQEKVHYVRDHDRW